MTFNAATDADDFSGVRIKEVRASPLVPGGRTHVSLFVSEDGGRPHPRMQFEMPPWDDPNPPAQLFNPAPAPADADSLRDAITAALADHAQLLAAKDPELDLAHPNSRKYARNSVRTQRIAGLFAEIRSFAAKAGLGAAGDYVITELEDLAYATRMQFDDVDTGTYHSYEKDAPFVHYLETILASLPPEGSEALAVLPSGEANAIMLQREQAQHHLDHLMRHKYAYAGIAETDIERTLGGLMIDRDTRKIVSETPETAQSLLPAYELLRVEPGSDHIHAAAWVYRSGAGIHLQDGTKIQVSEDQLRRVAVATHNISFARANGDPRLRKHMRLDWDNNGYVANGKIDWVSWAGHCDIKAIMEQLGVTLDDASTVTEYRSDTGATTVWTEPLLVEAIASVLELGSIYQRFDGSGVIKRGITRFGGARNDSRPDRIQLTGLGEGKHVRWPLTGRQDSFIVTGMTIDGEPVDLDTVFFAQLPDLDALELHDNPRFLKVIEGDYNLIDVSGATLEVELELDSIDPHTGYPVRKRDTTTIDLGPSPTEARYFMGTHVQDPAARELYRVYLDREHHQFVAELDRYEKQGQAWVAVPQPDKTVTFPLAKPLGCTLSREAKYDDPAMFQSLIEVALRTGQNICADTDMQAAVWNGVVLGLSSERTGVNRDSRVEAWKVEVDARFGRAGLAYLVARAEDGTPKSYCPAPQNGGLEAVDFLWQDFPDVGTKGKIGEDWVVNKTMVERGIVGTRVAPSSPGGLFIEDQHIKNLYEVLFCAMGGFPFTIVHGNKRWGYESEAAHQAAVAKLEALRGALKFEDGERDVSADGDGDDE
ncbi:hypothetical protein [Enhygromyxa salina]|uniref:Uncharacterized protein n=1 Tax=Enhygromyxa salina TaxID=215803 RepID=A0A2S9YTA5_9BACT|nr:hypothetical protein [Enhygromyxa salina]PRQ08262.1 hypothetical protein ENSA7_18840 [Enhygromyxa salina]